MGTVAGTGSSAKHMLCMMIMSVMMIMPTRATAAPSPSAPSSSFVAFQQLKEQVQQQGADKHHYEARTSEIFLQDYGIWNPTPYYGRGDMAPIPH
ncbi:hypothetical protein GBA52_002029 [Prunus armeniaca]|nr:hypothetical protein GBA52_002029 [Prunus armeniaca]